VSSTYGPPKKSLRALNRRSAQCFGLGGDGGLFRECALQIGPRTHSTWCRPSWFTRTIVASTARGDAKAAPCCTSLAFRVTQSATRGSALSLFNVYGRDAASTLAANQLRAAPAEQLEENRLDAVVTDKGRLAADPAAHQAFDLGRAWPVDGLERTPAPRWSGRL
jgi:hypothetical protein